MARWFPRWIDKWFARAAVVAIAVPALVAVLPSVAGAVESKATDSKQGGRVIVLPRLRGTAPNQARPSAEGKKTAPSEIAPSAGTETERAGETGRVIVLPRLRGVVPKADAAAGPEQMPAPRQEAEKEREKEAGKPEPERKTGRKSGGEEKPGAGAAKPLERQDAGADRKAAPKDDKAPAKDPARDAGRQSAKKATPLNPSRTIAISAELAGSSVLKQLLRTHRKAGDGNLKTITMKPSATAAAVLSGRVAGAIVSRHAGAIPQKGLVFTQAFHVDLFMIGPPKDTADVNGMVSLPEALKAIRQSQSAFLSAPPGSGISLLEQQVWRELGQGSNDGATWHHVFREASPDRLARLSEAARRGAYTLVDRVTWLAHTARRGKRRRLRILVRDDPRMQLAIGVLARTAQGNGAGVVRRLRDWLTGEAAAKIINRVTVNGTRPYLAERGLQR